VWILSVNCYFYFSDDSLYKARFYQVDSVSCEDVYLTLLLKLFVKSSTRSLMNFNEVYLICVYGLSNSIYILLMSNSINNTELPLSTNAYFLNYFDDYTIINSQYTFTNKWMDCFTCFNIAWRHQCCFHQLLHYWLKVGLGVGGFCRVWKPN